MHPRILRRSALAATTLPPAPRRAWRAAIGEAVIFGVTAPFALAAAYMAASVHGYTFGNWDAETAAIFAILAAAALAGAYLALRALWRIARLMFRKATPNE